MKPTAEMRERAGVLAKLMLPALETGLRNGDWNLAAFMMRDHPLIASADLSELMWALCRETAHKNDVVGVMEDLISHSLAAEYARGRNAGLAAAVEACEKEAREHEKLHDPELEDVAYSCAELILALAAQDEKEGE